MCTFLAVPFEKGYIVGSNRDDQFSRATEVTVTYDLQGHYQYVKDIIGGGTWLAVHDSGFYAVLLNNTPSNKTESFHTRGELPLRIINLFLQYKNTFSITTVLESIDFSQYNSCIIVIGYMSNGDLHNHIIRRDAVSKAYTIENSIGHIFISAPTLYPHTTQLVRGEESKSCADIISLKNFMQTHQYHIDDTCCIAKEGVVTKSTSIITYNSTVYYDFTSYGG